MIPGLEYKCRHQLQTPSSMQHRIAAILTYLSARVPGAIWAPLQGFSYEPNWHELEQWLAKAKDQYPGDLSQAETLAFVEKDEDSWGGPLVLMCRREEAQTSETQIETEVPTRLESLGWLLRDDYDDYQEDREVAIDNLSEIYLVNLLVKWLQRPSWLELATLPKKVTLEMEGGLLPIGTLDARAFAIDDRLWDEPPYPASEFDPTAELRFREVFESLRQYSQTVDNAFLTFSEGQRVVYSVGLLLPQHDWKYGSFFLVYFDSHRADHVPETLHYLREMGAWESASILARACTTVFGTTDVPKDRSCRQELTEAFCLRRDDDGFEDLNELDAAFAYRKDDLTKLAYEYYLANHP